MTFIKNIQGARITGSITASYAGDGAGLTGIISASNADTASYVDLVAGTNITINQTGTTYTINSTGGGGSAFPYTGSAIISGSLTVTGSINATQGITGSLFGTSSFAITASYATQALSSSYAVTASYAETASFSLATTENRILVLNQSGYTINKGIVVHITASGTSSDIPRIISASYESDEFSANTLGIARETITNGSQGFVTTEGVLTGLNTSAYTSGQLIYLGIAGSITGSAPRAPLHAVRLGQVIREQSVNGSIYVRIDNGYELEELHNVVDNTTTGSYGDLLMKSGSVWVSSKQLTGSYDITGSLTVSGSSRVIGTLNADGVQFIRQYNNNGNWFGGSLSVGKSVGATATLDVSGSAIITGSLNVAAGITGSGLQIAGNTTITNGLVRIQGNSSNELVRITQLGTGNAFVVEDSTNPDSSPFVINNAGNVGIGTTSPNAPLDVNGNTIITGSLTVSDGGVKGIILGTDTSIGNSQRSSRLLFSQQDSTKSTSIYAISGSMVFATSASYNSTSGLTRMFISESGNIGIGTSTPTLGNLQVLGNVYATSFTGSLQGTASNAVSSSFANNSITAVSSSTVLITYGFNIDTEYPILFSPISGSYATPGTDTNILYNTFRDRLTVTNVSASTITGSLFGTASWARNATTASFINVTNTNNASDYYIVGIDSDNGAQNPEQLYNFGTLSFNPDANTLKVANGAGIIQAASLVGTASYATTASYALNAAAPFPYTGSAQITGSLGVTGSFIVNEYDVYSGTYYDNINTTTQQINKVFGIGIDPQPGTVIDWGAETLNSYDSSYGTSGYISVDWGSKILYTAGAPFGITKASVDWGNRYLRYSNTIAATPPISVNWGAGTLNDTNGSVAVKWNTPGTLTVSASMVLSASVTASSGNSATSDALLQATLLYLSNNF